MKLCRRVWLRPLMHTREDLVGAARSLMRDGAGLVNIMFHSSESYPGTSPRTRGSDGVERFYGDLRAIIGALREAGEVTPCTLRDLVPNG